MADTSVGFIGLGDMGEPMAASILAAGYPVISCANRRRQAIESLATRGLVEVENPAKVAELAEILITCVLDEAQTEAVLREPDGALNKLKPGSVVIITSTVSPGYCQALAEEAAKRDIKVLDCPVSGGRARALEATLALICGGDAGAVEHCRPVLETMGTLHHCGEVGMGQVAKLVNAGMLFSIIKLVQEGRAIARAYDLDLETLMNVLANSTGNTAVGENWDMFVSIWPHAAGLGQKDMDLCIDAARAREVPVPLFEARRDMSWDLAEGD